MNELFNVKGKVVVITGGAGILGKGIAAYLAKEGAKRWLTAYVFLVYIMWMRFR